MANQTKQAIRERAYAIWEREGRPDGKALDHWLHAEAETIFENLLARWELYNALPTFPEKISLWGENGYGVWLVDTWGPPVGYGPIDHGDGHKNYGYRRVKGDQRSICEIPEVHGWPEFSRFLKDINVSHSLIESVGCEKGYFVPEDKTLPPIMIGSFVDTIFTNFLLNRHPQNFLYVLGRVIPAIRDCAKWWADISFVLERSRGIPGVMNPWGLMFHIKNYGRTEEEARKFWAESLQRIGNVISNLSPDFHAPGYE
jgi:hypothetical protein